MATFLLKQVPVAIPGHVSLLCGECPCNSNLIHLPLDITNVQKMSCMMGEELTTLIGCSTM